MSPTVIVIAGTCGTGKSTVGVEVAKKYNTKFIEGDTIHPKEVGVLHPVSLNYGIYNTNNDLECGENE